MGVGPPIPVSRYTEYRDTAVNVGGIDTGIVLSNTGVFGIGNSGSQQRQSCLCLASVGAAAVQRTSRLPCIITVGRSRTAAVCRSASIPTGVKDAWVRYAARLTDLHRVNYHLAPVHGRLYRWQRPVMCYVVL